MRERSRARCLLRLKLKRRFRGVPRFLTGAMRAYWCHSPLGSRGKGRCRGEGDMCPKWSEPACSSLHGSRAQG